MSNNRSLFIYFDGSFKQNTGSIGFIIKSQGGESLIESKSVIPNSNSSTESELIALKKSVEKIDTEFNIHDKGIYIFSDNQDIVNILDNKKPEFKDEKFQEYIVDSLDILDKAEFIIYNKVTQQENRDAHLLSNLTLKHHLES